jgi:hypothetical protein
MSTELRTKQPKNIIGHDNSSVVNWIHVAIIAPGLVRFCILLCVWCWAFGTDGTTGRRHWPTGLSTSSTCHGWAGQLLSYTVRLLPRTSAR